MTMPHLTNCPHHNEDRQEAWCLDCVQKLDETVRTQCQMIWDLRVDNQSLRDEIAKLRKAIKDSGYGILQASNGWSIHDVSDRYKAEQEKTDEIIMQNIELELEVKRLRERAERADRMVEFVRRNP